MTEGVWGWLRAPVFPDPRSRGRRDFSPPPLVDVRPGVRGCRVVAFDRRNDPLVTVAFYGVVVGWLCVVAAVARTGRIVLAAWVFSLFFWGLIACVTLVFGGMQGQNASTFAVCVLLIGSIVGGRAAIFMAFGKLGLVCRRGLPRASGTSPRAGGPLHPSMRGRRSRSRSR